jgi:SMI1/KNR4 family protein SUKH-1
MMAAPTPQTSLTITQALDLVERDRPLHMTSEPAGATDLDHLEAALGLPLPAEFREFLRRLGGSILYERHEMFGARRLMVHDIELVPDLLSFREQFTRRGPSALRPGFIPFHRADGVVSLFDLREGAEPAVVTEDGVRSYSSLACFLERAVLRDREPPEPR